MNLSDLIYLDNNATTRVDPAVVDAMAPYWSTDYLNPSSVAGELFRASVPIHAAKQSLASTLGGTPDEFFLTSGATESNNWVLQATINRNLRVTGKCHVISTSIEHPSVLETLNALCRWNPNLSVDLIPVDGNGLIQLDAFNALVTKDTALVSIILANNETGVIQPVGEAARITKGINPLCLFHSDATQAVGKIPVHLDNDLAEVDFLSLSAHKFHGPKGIGALFVRSGSTLDSWFLGGSQQNGLRAGTESPALANGLSTALSLAVENLPLRSAAMKMLRDHLESELAKTNPDIRFLGSKAPRLPNTTLLLVPYVEGDLMVHRLLESGIATSTGSACSNGSDQPSHVIIAMGVTFALARNAIRVSLSHMNSKAELERSIAALRELVTPQP